MATWQQLSLAVGWQTTDVVSCLWHRDDACMYKCRNASHGAVGVMYTCIFSTIVRRFGPTRSKLALRLAISALGRGMFPILRTYVVFSDIYLAFPGPPGHLHSEEVHMQP